MDYAKLCCCTYFQVLENYIKYYIKYLCLYVVNVDNITKIDKD